jgi:ribosomal-protein-alanine N-acetyltransferase
MALKLTPSSRNERTLTTRRTYLREPQPGDWPAWSELRNASRAFLTPWEPAWASDGLTRASYRRRLRRQVKDESDDLGYAFFLFRASDEALMGGITLGNVQRGAAQSATIGYWMGQRYAGQGYMSEALSTLLAHAFGPLGLHRVEAACMVDNARSRRLLERCNFHQEGYARHYLKINGVWSDHLLFALLATDYPAAVERLDAWLRSRVTGG